MPYLLVDNFAAGLDLRKSEVTAPAGTLRKIRNAHVTPGGEIEKRKAFIEVGQVPSDSFGLVSSAGVTYVFKNGSFPPIQTAEYTLIGLVSGDADDLSAIIDFDIYDGDIYLVAETVNGAVQHFYPATPGDLDFTFINNSNAQSRAVRTYRKKVHGVNGKNLLFSAIDNPSDYAGVGSGFVNLSTEDAESQDLVGLEVYFDTLAVMSKRAIQIWRVDPDPTAYQQVQVLRAAGTDAPNSLKQFGSGDVLYLAQSGVRSLQSRDSSNSASVSDIGSPIDEYIREMRQTRSAAYMQSAKAIIEPLSNRFWMVFPEEILVLSAFPNPRVTAWSIYEPQFTIVDVVVEDERILLRGDDNKLYAYGPEEYDATEAEVLTPFMNADRPATRKMFSAIDVACQGKWSIFARFNPNNPTAEDKIAVITDTTFAQDDVGMDAVTTHVALRVVTNASTAATLAHLVLHYELGDDG